MNWNTATTAQVREKIATAVAKGCGLTVSPLWLARILNERRTMAELAMCLDEPQYDSPLAAIAAKGLRDRILREEQA